MVKVFRIARRFRCEIKRARFLDGCFRGCDLGIDKFGNNSWWVASNFRRRDLVTIAAEIQKILDEEP